MGHIIYIMGKSATGKDTIYTELRGSEMRLRAIVLYTTRPIRQDEQDGREYHFTDEAALDAFERSGKLIEKRTYPTMCGPWSYATIDDGRVDLTRHSYIVIGTLESYLKVREYYGHDALLPIYIEVDDGIRLQRSLNREMKEKEPKFAEVCRRYLADEEDFSEEKLKEAGIVKRYKNEDLKSCLDEIREDIKE